MEFGDDCSVLPALELARLLLCARIGHFPKRCLKYEIPEGTEKLGRGGRRKEIKAEQLLCVQGRRISV